MNKETELDLQKYKLSVFYILKCKGLYYTGDRIWEREYNYGWSTDKKEAQRFNTKTEAECLIREGLTNLECRSFSFGDRYKIKTIYKVEEI